MVSLFKCPPPLDTIYTYPCLLLCGQVLRTLPPVPTEHSMQLQHEKNSIGLFQKKKKKKSYHPYWLSAVVVFDTGNIPGEFIWMSSSVGGGGGGGGLRFLSGIAWALGIPQLSSVFAHALHNVCLEKYSDSNISGAIWVLPP